MSSGQKSQKGRQSAAQQIEQVFRRSNRPKVSVSAGQQFGGVGQRRDKDSERLSSRAKKALDEQGSSPKKRVA